MTWLNRLNNVELEVITGDGKIFKPLWQNAQKEVKYNTEGFDFVNVPGTFVERKEQSGNQFPILFYFKGEDCIEDAAEFELSAADKRPWTIKHPFYDDLLVQPLNLSFDNSVYNISRITGTLWQTITTKFPEDEVLPDKLITNLKAENDLQVSTSFVTNVPDPSINLIAPATAAVVNINKNYLNLPELEDDIKLLKDLTRTASGAAQNLLNDVDGFINSTIALINFPFQIVQDIQFKIEKIKDSINELLSIFDTSKPEEQFLYEAIATTSLTTISQININPESSDYETRPEVVEAFELLNETYDSVLSDFDSIQESDDFVQDSTLAQQLDVIVNFSLANLFEIAFESKQERSILLEKDDNVINLAHRFVGPGDNNLNTFINQNEITLDEHVNIKKGREIIWFV